jgi:hypothetical protein
LLAVAAAGPSSFPPRRMLGGEGDTEAVEYKLGIYSVWGSNKPEDGKPPEELKKFIDELKRTSGKKSFRLEGAPRSEKLLEGKQVVVKLPDGYQARWEAVREKGKEKLALRQVLVNPRGEESAVLLRSSPVITSLEKIRRGDDPFLLIVEFEKVSSRN